MRRSVTTVVVAVVAVLVLLSGDWTAAPRPAGQDLAGSPVPVVPAPEARNAIVFLVDDMSDFACKDVRRYLPRSSHWLSRHGTCYENAATATPVCCPARAQVQTGQLPHNNRVRTQLEARRLRAHDTVQHDLGRDGLRTYGIGKNLNGVQAEEYYGRSELDTGFEEFDFWNSYRLGPGTFRRYDDTGKAYTPDDGLSSVETNGRLLDEALDEYLTTGERFYVYDAFFAPHKQATGTATSALPLPTPRHRRSPVPRFRYAPEREARDKLPMFRQPQRSRAYHQRLWTARIRTLYDVDLQIARAFLRLREAGVLDETAVFFASDNGYTDRGQANWEGKSIPYPAATSVPLLAWYPGRAPAVVRRGVQLIDIPATVYDVLGVRAGHRLDGHSLLGPHQRSTLYGEFFAENDKAALEESGQASSAVKSWRMLKRGRWSYVEWYRDDGRLLARELYADPGMLRNVLWRGHRGPRPSAAFVGSLHRELVRTSRCAGTTAQRSPNPCP